MSNSMPSENVKGSKAVAGRQLSPEEKKRLQEKLVKVSNKKDKPVEKSEEKIPKKRFGLF